MRGRTNIPPRVGGIVNGAVKNCIVASDNDIKIGDYVQLNLKKGALPVMLKDTNAYNAVAALSSWLFYSFKTFALSDGNIANISLHSVTGGTVVASQVVLIDDNGVANGIRVTKTTLTGGKLVTSNGYGVFSVCRLYEDCFLVIHSSYYKGEHDYCRAGLIKYIPSTKTFIGTALDTSGIIDNIFKGYDYYTSNIEKAYNAMGVVSDRVIRFVRTHDSLFAYEVFVDEANAAITCKQLSLNYGESGANYSLLSKALQSLEEFSEGYFGLLYQAGAYCSLVGDVVTVIQYSTAEPGIKIVEGMYASGGAYTQYFKTEELVNRTLSDVRISAGVTCSVIGSAYVGEVTYDVIVKADAISKQLDVQDSWENDYYTAASSHNKAFTYFGIAFVKCGEGIALGIMPVPQVAFLDGNYSGSSQQQLLTGCYCGFFTFDETTKQFSQSVLTFDTFIPFEEPMLIYTMSTGASYSKGYTLCGIESAFVFDSVVRIGLWFYSRYSNEQCNEYFMPFTIKVKDGKVVDFSDKNIVEKYTHHVFGIAKTSGVAGEPIEVYIPE